MNKLHVILPNLFIPGAAKSGTTTLHELLNHHPAINMSSIKEPVFWNTNAPNLQHKVRWYNSLFENPSSKILGESTTSYMYFPKFITNIKTHYTETEPKFIFILRNPIDRLYSHYWWMVGRGQEKLNLFDAISKDKNREFQEYDYIPDYYYHFGLYNKWLKTFYLNFKKENIKIITLESLKQNRLKTVNECFAFLNLKTLNYLPEITANKTQKMKFPKSYHFIKKTASGKYKFTKLAKYIISRKTIEKVKLKLKKNSYFDKSLPLNYPKLSDTERQKIYNLYKNDVLELKRTTNLSFPEWKDFE